MSQSAKKTSSERPIALVVGDKLDILNTRRQLFTQLGFQAIGARSVTEALREFRSTPTIDIVVTDINLDPKNEHDRSGIDLARAVKDRRPSMPLIAVSGAFDSLDAQDREVFDDSLLKGRLMQEIQKKIAEWHERALQYRRGRAEKALGELQRIRGEGPPSDPRVEVLRDFLPGTHLPSFAEPGDELETPDEMLRKAGWRLRLVEAGFKMPDGDVKTAIAVPFWIRSDGDSSVAVLHGHSCVYHDGPDDDAVVRGALELMFGYAREFKEDPVTLLSCELSELRIYLNLVFR